MDGQYMLDQDGWWLQVAGGTVAVVAGTDFRRPATETAIPVGGGGWVAAATSYVTKCLCSPFVP